MRRRKDNKSIPWTPPPPRRCCWLFSTYRLDQCRRGSRAAVAAASSGCLAGRRFVIPSSSSTSSTRSLLCRRCSRHDYFLLLWFVVFRRFWNRRHERLVPFNAMGLVVGPCTIHCWFGDPVGLLCPSSDPDRTLPYKEIVWTTRR
jgi:hypothetical protein